MSTMTIGTTKIDYTRLLVKGRFYLYKIIVDGECIGYQNHNMLPNGFQVFLPGTGGDAPDMFKEADARADTLDEALALLYDLYQRSR